MIPGFINYLGRAWLDDEVACHRVIMRRTSAPLAFVTGDERELAGATQAEAEAYWELARLYRLGGAMWMPNLADLLEFACRLHEARMQTLIAQGKLDAAAEELEACLRMLPGDVRSVGRMVAALDRAGQKDAAQKLFDRSAGLYRKLIAKYAQCARFRSALGDLGKACGREVPDTATPASRPGEGG